MTATFQEEPLFDDYMKLSRFLQSKKSYISIYMEQRKQQEQFPKLTIIQSLDLRNATRECFSHDMTGKKHQQDRSYTEENI